MRGCASTDTFRFLPLSLVDRAAAEMRNNGKINPETQAHLIDHGADPHRLVEQVKEHEL